VDIAATGVDHNNLGERILAQQRADGVAKRRLGSIREYDYGKI
jgi:hypothetical protein